MRSFVKYILLLVFAVLAGSGQGYRAEVSPTSTQAPAQERGPDKLSANKLYKLVGLQRPEERVHIAQHLPAPPLKNSAAGCLPSSYAFELRVQSLVSQYVVRARSIIGSLTIRDIIFPFHYFW